MNDVVIGRIVLVSFFGLHGAFGCHDTPAETETEITTATLVNHLGTPGVYDNAQSPPYYGQTFVAEGPSFAGVRIYIGDPERPDDANVNALVGPADLVLYDVANLAAPIELARAEVVAPGQQVGFATGGVAEPVTLSFCAPVATGIGAKYFFAIEADDDFGLGLREQYFSTYAGGAESVRHPATGVIEENPLGRDLSFEVVASPAAPNCNPDSDGDGVANAADQCPGTGAGETVDAGGCSIAQLCPCALPWKNHGAYVSCVAHAANRFRDEGRITAAENAAVTSAAAGSSCGHK